MTISQSVPSWPGWETVRLIGRGSFGTVYEIRKDLLGDTERCALKHISIPQDESEIQEMRLEGQDGASITQTFTGQAKDIVAEYRLMKQLNDCANVVSCQDVEAIQKDNGYGWDILIRMELLTPLKSYLLQQQDFPEAEVIRLGREMANALVACGKCRILHRDIKPENIMVAPDGTYKLGDFGIARMTGKSSSATSRIGTYAYMAPEVYNSRHYGAAADLYSLGMVLYWLLNGRRAPFVNVNTAEEKENALERRMSGEEIPAPLYGSPELQRIVLKCCAFYPEERYQSPEELVKALDAVGAIHESPADPGERRFAPVGVGAPDDPRTGTNINGLSRTPAPTAETAFPAEDETEGVFRPHASKEEKGRRSDTTDSFPRGGKNVMSSNGDHEEDSPTEGQEKTEGLYLHLRSETGKSEPPRKKSAKPLILIGAVSLVLLLLIGFLTIHTWKPASCTEPETCSICGKTRGDALGHDWIAATCLEPETCSRCGATRGEAHGHDWAPTSCTQPATCRICGTTEGSPLGHDWADATCTEPKTCRVCGTTEGSALGHRWKDATCTEPKTCSVCGATEGSALGHRWEDATCTEPKTCSVCGTTEGSALGHNWADATYTAPKTCRRCGETSGEPLERVNTSGYTHDGIWEAAVRASNRDANYDSSWRYTIMGREEDNGKVTTNDPRELYVPSDDELLDTPFQMKIKSKGGVCTYIMPIPEQGHGTLGKIGDYDHTDTSHRHLTYHKLVTVVAVKRVGNITYYFFVTDEGIAGWNGSDLFADP